MIDVLSGDRLIAAIQFKHLPGHHTVGVQAGAVVPGRQPGDGWDPHRKILKDFERHEHRTSGCQ